MRVPLSLGFPRKMLGVLVMWFFHWIGIVSSMSFFSFVGRGPVPRDRQEMRGTGPRTTMGAAFFFMAVGRGPVPRDYCHGPFSIGQERLLLTPFAMSRARACPSRS